MHSPIAVSPRSSTFSLYLVYADRPSTCWYHALVLHIDVGTVRIDIEQQETTQENERQENKSGVPSVPAALEQMSPSIRPSCTTSTPKEGYLRPTTSTSVRCPLSDDLPSLRCKLHQPFYGLMRAWRQAFTSLAWDLLRWRLSSSNPSLFNQPGSTASFPTCSPRFCLL